MAILAENNTVIYTDGEHTLSGFMYTDNIKGFSHIENGYTLIFDMLDGTQDFFNLRDIMDTLAIKPFALKEDALYMHSSSQSVRQKLIEDCHAAMQGFAIWYDVTKPTVTLNIIYLENPSLKAVMTKRIQHLEVDSSNMPLDVLYKMKFVMERNEKQLFSEWKERKYC